MSHYTLTKSGLTKLSTGQCLKSEEGNIKKITESCPFYEVNKIDKQHSLEEIKNLILKMQLEIEYLNEIITKQINN